MTKPSDIVCEFRCWQGRRILLYRSTLLNHVLRFHLESAFVLDALKANFSKPICVIENKQNKTLNAFYNIETNGLPFLLVAVKIQKKLRSATGKPHFIKTFYGVTKIPNVPPVWGVLP